MLINEKGNENLCRQAKTLENDMNKFRKENKINVVNNDASDESFDEIPTDGSAQHNWVEVPGSSSSNSNESAKSEKCSSVDTDSVFSDFTPTDASFPMDASTVMRTSIKKESLTDKNPSKIIRYNNKKKRIKIEFQVQALKCYSIQKSIFVYIKERLKIIQYFCCIFIRVKKIKNPYTSFMLKNS